MQNVKLWRNNSIAFAAENICVEQPNVCNEAIDEVDLKMIDLIEREFTDYERKMNQKEWTDQDQYKRRKLNEDMVKVNFTKNDAKGKIEHGDSGNHSAKSIEVPVSLPHSKSLSNNRSRSSKNEIANDSNAQMTNFP